MTEINNKELRETLEKKFRAEMVTIGISVEDAKTGQMWAFDAERLSKIVLALLQPKIEEARRQGEIECVAEFLEAGIQVCGIKDIIIVLKATENYARRQERRGLSDLISMYLQEEPNNRTHQVLTSIKKSLLFGKP